MNDDVDLMSYSMGQSMKKKTKATRKKKKEDSDEGSDDGSPNQKRPKVVREFNLPAIMDTDGASTWQDRLNSPKADLLCPHSVLAL